MATPSNPGAHPHGYRYELKTLAEQLRVHPETPFRFQMPLEGRSGPELVRFDPDGATVIQSKSYGRPGKLKDNVLQQVDDDMTRLARTHFKVPGPEGVPVPVKPVIKIHVDKAQLQLGAKKMLASFRDAFEQEINQALEASGMKHPAPGSRSRRSS